MDEFDDDGDDNNGDEEDNNDASEVLIPIGWSEFIQAL